MARRGYDELSVKVDGLAKLRRDLRAINKDLGKSLTDHIREIAKEVRDDARPRTPELSGALRRSEKYSVRTRGAAIYSKLPYAGVQEWGGTIHPRGAPIKIRGRHFLYSAVDQNAAHIKAELERSLDEIADRNGFH
jgi:phage gpG-like protein